MEYGHLRPRKRARQAGLAAATAMLAGLTFSALPALAEELKSEPFTSSYVSKTGWVVTSLGSTADHPCITAAAADQTGSIDSCVGGATDEPGNGVFRFTSNAQLNGNAGALMHDRELDARRGLTFEFDMYMYDPKPYNEPVHGARGGDGLSFYLVDGKSPASVGQPGGWLGYKGLKGAFAGVGFDAYGNFSNPRIFDPGTGAPQGCDPAKWDPKVCVKPNSVVVRGAESTKYAYINGVTLPATQKLLNPTAKEHNAARQHVVVDISTKGVMNVGIRFTPDGELVPVVKDLDLERLPNQPGLPASVKVGWAASTGAATAKHAISGFQARTLDADAKLTLTNDGPWTAGGTGSYTATVSAAENYGYIDDPVKTVIDIPAGVKPTAAAGDGWTCAIAGQKVTCDRPAGEIAPGESAPPVKIDVAVDKATDGTVTAKGTVEQVSDVVGGVEVNPADNTAESPADVTGAVQTAPDLTQTTEGPATLAPGESGKITTTVTNEGTGPTNGVVTVTGEAPAPLKLVGVSGDGWDCKVDGSKYTCTRPGTGDDALEPDGSYPPVIAEVTLPEGAPASGSDIPVNTTVNTDGDSNPDNNDATTNVKVPAVDPAPEGQLDVDITSDPNPYVPGKPYTYTVKVSNTGDTDVKDAEVTADWPTPWDNIKWTCTSKGGACPAASGTGDLRHVISLAAGGQMTFKVTCIMPKDATASYEASATVKAAATNCADGCTATDENKAAAPARKKKK